ncbi:dirigent protein 24-like [Amaranthus tricolor]|uniref:dirigent protein 24-like n=1 Tax=Amaranthus tricolor TaxID=29722 RepID=UPI0025828FCE|nr:dirigent protein 24-like [Amaranthus tricolor]
MSKFLCFPSIFILILYLTLALANSARLLDEAAGPQLTPPDELPPLPPVEDDSPPTILSSAQAPPTAAAPPADDDELPNPDDQPDPNPTTNDAPAVPEPAPEPAPLPTGPAQNGVQNGATGPAQNGATGPAQNGATGPGSDHPAHPAISFFMHDVLGGSSASGRIVTGLIATSDVNGIPFSRPNNQVFPVTNGVPLLNNGNLNNVLNNNNVPFLAGLTGQNQPKAQTIIQNTGTNNVVNGGNNNQAFVTPGQLPTGTALQKLLFGSITVIDDELTAGHELGSGIMGRGQGFYLASSLDGESHTMAFTAVFHGGEHDLQEGDDTLSFFGVHRTASPISSIAVIGGSGKYENAKGYATIETLPDQDQHTTDGVDTIAHFSVYLY